MINDGEKLLNKTGDGVFSTPSTCVPSLENSPLNEFARAKSEVLNPAKRYVASMQVLGGGMKGVVQRGVDSWTETPVALKRIECDRMCPIRFLELLVGGRHILSAEGHAPVDSTPASFAGVLVYDAENVFLANPISSTRVQGCVLLARRGGGASFAVKLRHAHRAGAAGVIIINGEDTSEVYSTGEEEAPIPSVMLARADGEAVLSAVLDSQATGRSTPRASVCTDVQHELAICRRLPPHEHLAQVLDMWEDGAAAVVVMELCRGGKVHTPPRGPRSLEVALRLVRQMLLGLSHLHANGVCHRDLKPENMLLTEPLEDPDARVVLVDFSMASTASRMRVPCGSPRYLAPEVLSGGYGPERDIWSIGMVAHELIFGCHPFGEMTEHEVVNRLLSDPGNVVLGNADVPQAVSDLLSAMLQVDPDARPTAEAALAYPCFRV